MISKLELGEAYGFFDCATPKALIQTSLHKFIQESGSVRSTMALTELMTFIKGDVDSALLKLILSEEVYPIVPSGWGGDKSPIRMVNLKYVIKANYVDVSNETAADDLGMVLNRVYQTFEDRKPFYATVAWKENGEYCLSK